MSRSMIAILDLGSTENAAVAREIRALGMYSEIFAHDVAPEALKAIPGIAGIVINGGENNIVDGAKIDVCEGIYSIGLPVLQVAHEGAHSGDLAAYDENGNACGSKHKEFKINGRRVEERNNNDTSKVIGNSKRSKENLQSNGYSLVEN